MTDVIGDKCCKSFPNLGPCEPGRDDNPELEGKCFFYCVGDCWKGKCIKSGNSYVCQCQCK